MSDGAYSELAARYSRMGLLGDVLGILEWDRATLMQPGSAEGRTEQVAMLRVMHHEMAIDPAIGDLLDKAEGGPDAVADPWVSANIARMRHDHAHATAVPADLVGAHSKAVSACEMRWRTARQESDFKGLLPSLTEVLRLTREVAAAKSAALGLSPYDALLDMYEPEMRAAIIDPIFDDLATFLPSFLGQVLDKQAQQPQPNSPAGPFPVAAQQRLARRFMDAIGFDFERGRLDVSDHPFCGGASDDQRITTRYDETDALTGLMAVLHETGHALYEGGLPAEWQHQPVGRALGMATHESQSLIIEMQACRSAEFVAFAGPVLVEVFGSDPAWEPGNLHRIYTRVAPGFIRVDADEVTYPVHVILRYRLEQALIAGDMVLPDLPAAWNAGMQELLGITPPDDALGCLQDIHWPGGAWGYFPTYTLGAMAAAQLFAAAKAAEPDLLPGIARGDFRPLVGWLRENVHRHGSRDSAAVVLQRATGRPLDPTAFKDHLATRYLH